MGGLGPHPSGQVRGPGLILGRWEATGGFRECWVWEGSPWGNADTSWRDRLGRGLGQGFWGCWAKWNSGPLELVLHGAGPRSG